MTHNQPSSALRAKYGPRVGNAVHVLLQYVAQGMDYSEAEGRVLDAGGIVDDDFVTSLRAAYQAQRQFPEHNPSGLPAPDPHVGEKVFATGKHGRTAGREFEVTRLLKNTIWTKPTAAQLGFFRIAGEEFSEDFVTRDIFWETFQRRAP